MFYWWLKIVMSLHCVFGTRHCFCFFVFISYIHPANLRHVVSLTPTTISLYGGHPANCLLTR